MGCLLPSEYEDSKNQARRRPNIPFPIAMLRQNAVVKHCAAQQKGLP